MDVWAVGIVVGLVLALVGGGLMLAGGTGRALVEAPFVERVAVLSLASAPRQPIEIELAFRVAPAVGHRIYVQMKADGVNLPPVVQIADTPDAVGPAGDVTGPAVERSLRVARFSAPEGAPLTVRIELTPAPWTRVEGAIARLERV